VCHSGLLNASLDAGNFVMDEFKMDIYAGYEQRIDDVLVIANKHVMMKGIQMDHMERWSRLGGSHFVAGLSLYPVDACTFKNNCGTYGLQESPRAANTPKLDAVKSFIAGQVGPLPFTSADVPSEPTPTCSSGCVWGFCVANGTVVVNRVSIVRSPSCRGVLCRRVFVF
jgi:hypothetical protein